MRLHPPTHGVAASNAWGCSLPSPGRLHGHGRSGGRSQLPEPVGLSLSGEGPPHGEALPRRVQRRHRRAPVGGDARRRPPPLRRLYQHHRGVLQPPLLLLRRAALRLLHLQLPLAFGVLAHHLLV